MFKKGVNYASLTDAGDLSATDTDTIFRNGKTYFALQTAKNKLFRKVPAGSRSVTLPAVLTNTDNDKTIIITGGSGNISVDATITDGFVCTVVNKSSNSATFSTTSGIISEISGLLSIASGGSANILMAAASVMAISSNSATATNNAPTGPTASGGNTTTAATAATTNYPTFIFSSGAETYDTISPCFGSASWNSQNNGSASLNFPSNKFCISLWVRGVAGKSDFTGNWLAITDANNNILGVSTYNTGLHANLFNAQSGSNTADNSDSNVYDDNWHLVTINYDGSELCVLVDGGYHAARVSGPFIGGACILSLYGSIGPNGTGIDGVKISDGSKYPYNSATYPTNQIAPVREANDIVIWQFDGNGLGS